MAIRVLVPALMFYSVIAPRLAEAIPIVGSPFDVILER
jgi:hypothetical protein